MDVEYISLHGYIRNAPSDTEHQLKVDSSTWAEENNMQNHPKLCRTKELGGKTGVLVALDLSLVGGGTETGV